MAKRTCIRAQWASASTSPPVAASPQSNSTGHSIDIRTLATRFRKSKCRTGGSCLSLAARCYEVTRLGYLGADIVLDVTRGPLLLELNARPGPYHSGRQRSRLVATAASRRIARRVAALPVEERVDYSVEHFAHSVAHCSRRYGTPRT